MKDLTEYRQKATEKERANDLMNLIPSIGGKALDVGARDGYFSKLMSERFDIVTALDLQRPSICYPKVYCVEGDVTCLNFDDNSFDFVLCAEVLEHIPPDLLTKACIELGRVTKSSLLIGVPYKQDIRSGRTTCYTCGKVNPPWGHVNRFDEKRLEKLFNCFATEKVHFVGHTKDCTNYFSALLMDIAGNPFGTYSQEEPCIHCGAKIKSPPERNLLKKVITKAAFTIETIHKTFNKEHPNWIHMLFNKSGRNQSSAPLRGRRQNKVFS